MPDVQVTVFSSTWRHVWVSDRKVVVRLHTYWTCLYHFSPICSATKKKSCSGGRAASPVGQRVCIHKEVQEHCCGNALRGCLQSYDIVHR